MENKINMYSLPASALVREKPDRQDPKHAKRVRRGCGSWRASCDVIAVPDVP